MSDLKLEIIHSPKRKSYFDQYEIKITDARNSDNPNVCVKYYPRFRDIQDLHLQLTKILMES